MCSRIDVNRISNNKNKGQSMINTDEIKKIMVETTKETVDKNLPVVMSAIEVKLIEVAQNDGVKESVATWFNKKINIPWMNEEQEQNLLEKALDKVRDLVAVMIPKLFKALLKGK